ncbi:hypothetical protein [Actinokineospora sp.]|uniref:hypothetical protein n=1 Tax=Actinokineospora sp. TaxID=1872133 RepID=UPI003D6C1ADA
MAVAVRELTAIGSALDAVMEYAREDDLVPGMFGVLGEQLGAASAFAQVRDELRMSFERAVPSIDELARSVEDSANAATAVDEESAALISRAGGELT